MPWGPQKADISVGHTTDSQITDLGLVILKDDKFFFPDYFESPIARKEVLDVVPEMRDHLIEFAKLNFANEDITALIQDYSDSPTSLASQVQLLLQRKR